MKKIIIILLVFCSCSNKVYIGGKPPKFFWYIGKDKMGVYYYKRKNNLYAKSNDIQQR